MTLDEAKEIARSFLGDDSPARVFRAGVIMLAPMIKGFAVDEIMEVTGYKRNVVERVTTNLVRWGIWGADTWCAEWPELFITSMEEMPDDKPDRLAISFVLDAMVGAGELGRTNEDGEFKYTAIDIRGL